MGGGEKRDEDEKQEWKSKDLQVEGGEYSRTKDSHAM